MPNDVTKQLKILVITKSIQLQQELRSMLDSYFLVCVENAEQAIERLLVSADFAAILVGIYMPETRGFQFLDYLKGHQNLYNGPVLIITDAVNDDVIDRVK